eukprot:GILK01007848.1.p1 GENE.GILK01007848.1~~GILK01007848.1.p1  ORF type:complete len:844 (-),score=102.45 GILK01007848.1:243-2735(-)
MEAVFKLWKFDKMNYDAPPKEGGVLIYTAPSRQAIRTAVGNDGDIYWWDTGHHAWSPLDRLGEPVSSGTVFQQVVSPVQETLDVVVGDANANDGDANANDVFQALTNAFNAPYVDDGLLPLFKEHIAMCFAYPNDYYRYTTIVQSSGYGKSRLVKEYAKQAYTIQICLRPLGWRGFPPRWDTIAHYLEPDYATKERFVILFAVCVDALCVYLEQERDNASYEGFNLFYRNHIEAAFKNERVLANMELRRAPQQLLICFDEPAVWLQSGDIKPFLKFRYATEELYLANALCVLTDTTAKIANFTPSTPRDPSTRAITQKMHLMRPFYFLWSSDLPAVQRIRDLWPNLPPREQKLFRLFCLGRPLWRSWLELAEGNPSKLVRFAQTKLACSYRNSSNSSYFHLALLSCRYSLYLVPQSQSCDTLLAGHMATCLWLSRARESVLVSYVSEPVLAEAAAEILSHNQLQSALNSLASALMNGVVEPGYRGELVARILLLPLVKGNKQYYSEKITVRMYFVALLGQNNFDTYIASFPPSLLDGFVTATHFVPITYEISSADQLKGLYCRRAAAICKRNQKGDDLLIPIKLKVNNYSVYSVIKVHCKNWQSEVHFKRVTSLGMEHLSAATREQSWRKTFAKWPKDSSIPFYVNLYLQLGADNAVIYDPYTEIAKLTDLFDKEEEALREKASVLDSEWLVKKQTQLEATGRQLKALPLSADENQFSLMLVGCSATVYPWAFPVMDELKRLLTAWPDALALTNSEASKSCYSYFAKENCLKHVQSALKKSLEVPRPPSASMSGSGDTSSSSSVPSQPPHTTPSPVDTAVEPLVKRQRRR